jgi:hypothetical protein
MKQWLELLRQLGDAVLELVAAEASALADDLRRGGRQAARVVALLAVTVVLATLAWALVTVAAVAALAPAIGLWQAALAIGAVYAVVATVCGVAARNRWRRIEAPVETVRRRIEDQRTWLRDHLFDRSAAGSTLETGGDHDRLTGDSQ